MQVWYVYKVLFLFLFLFFVFLTWGWTWFLKIMTSVKMCLPLRKRLLIYFFTSNSILLCSILSDKTFLKFECKTALNRCFFCFFFLFFFFFCFFFCFLQLNVSIMCLRLGYISQFTHVDHTKHYRNDRHFECLPKHRNKLLL